MLNFKELWIGDKVFDKSLNVNGSWEGNIDSNYAKIKVNGEIVSIQLKDIEKARYDKQESEALKALKDELIEKNNNKPFKIDDVHGNTLDLHIEKLNARLRNETPHKIFKYQMMRADVFVKDAIERRKVLINIVHGIGNGVLKKELKYYLESIPEVKSIYDKNGGGCSEIWFEY